jgi:protein-S-isoprenylcysteine O-methyltransferase Ste14
VLLLTSNWLIGLCWIAIIISVIAIRVLEQERLLLKQFGDEYREYMERTWRFFPRLRNSA